MKDKLVLITGATNGIGLAAAKALAARGARIALVARNEEKGREAAAAVKESGGEGSKVDVLAADLSSQASVRRLAAEALKRYPRIDVLVNNAGAIYGERRLTEDGVELTWAVNHLAPFLLTKLLAERLKAGAPSRVITTSSGAHKGTTLPFDAAGVERASSGFRRYGETKLANILFTRELARRLEGTRVAASCYHPGGVATGFGREYGPVKALFRVLKLFLRSPEKGAETLVWLAESADAAGATGGYYYDKRLREPSAAARDMESARRLWELSERQTAGSAAA